MARHVKTDHTWCSKGKVWVFYEATQAELQTMRKWCESTFAAGLVEFGTQDVVRLIDFRLQDLYRMAFVFDNRDDAMRFKLSW